MQCSLGFFSPPTCLYWRRFVLAFRPKRVDCATMQTFICPFCGDTCRLWMWSAWRRAVITSHAFEPAYSWSVWLRSQMSPFWELGGWKVEWEGWMGGWEVRNSGWRNRHLPACRSSVISSPSRGLLRGGSVRGYGWGWTQTVLVRGHICSSGWIFNRLELCTNCCCAFLLARAIVMWLRSCYELRSVEVYVYPGVLDESTAAR
jgi:hypothetical protein